MSTNFEHETEKLFYCVIIFVRVVYIGMYVDIYNFFFSSLSKTDIVLLWLSSFSLYHTYMTTITLYICLLLKYCCRNIWKTFKNICQSYVRFTLMYTLSLSTKLSFLEKLSFKFFAKYVLLLIGAPRRQQSLCIRYTYMHNILLSSRNK